MRLDAVALDQPGQVGGRAIGCVGHEALEPEVEALLRPLDHPALGGHLGLPYRGRGLDIDDHRMIEVDQIVGAVSDRSTNRSIERSRLSVGTCRSRLKL